MIFKLFVSKCTIPDSIELNNNPIFSGKVYNLYWLIAAMASVTCINMKDIMA